MNKISWNQGQGEPEGCEASSASPGSDLVFIYNFDILSLVDFCINFDFANYCMKASFILTTAFFWSPHLNFVPNMNASLVLPSPGPAPNTPCFPPTCCGRHWELYHLQQIWFPSAGRFTDRKQAREVCVSALTHLLEGPQLQRTCRLEGRPKCRQ